MCFLSPSWHDLELDLCASDDHTIGGSMPFCSTMEPALPALWRSPSVIVISGPQIFPLLSDKGSWLERVYFQKSKRCFDL